MLYSFATEGCVNGIMKLFCAATNGENEKGRVKT